VQQKRILTKTFEDFLLERELLEEGLIYSYGGDIFLKRIKQNFGKYIIDSEAIPLFSVTEKIKPMTVTVIFKKDIQTRLEELKKLMNFYGYFVSKQEDAPNNISFQFEPKYPVKYKKEQLDGFNIYHIAPKNRLHKIFSIGLSPKQSTTTFDHPANRIYLFFTNDVRYVQVFRRNLAKDREIEEDKLAILEIEEIYDDVFVDESFQYNPPNYFAGFVLKNIYPSQIKMTNL
jgi:hypothetical protein